MKNHRVLLATLGCLAFALAGFGVGALLGSSKSTTFAESNANTVSYVVSPSNSLR